MRLVAAHGSSSATCSKVTRCRANRVPENLLLSPGWPGLYRGYVGLNKPVLPFWAASGVDTFNASSSQLC